MKKTAGFTLIEVLIVVSIVAILAAIAIPAYQDSITKGRRTDAASALQGLAQAMERFYTERGTYVGAAGTGGVPSIFPSKSPIDGSATYYTLTISAAAANSYTLTATATGAQAGNGNLTLSSTGARTWDRNNDGAISTTTGSSENCWETSC